MAAVVGLVVACALVGSRLDNANSVLPRTTQKKTSPNSRKHRTSLPVSLPVPLNLAVQVLSPSGSTDSTRLENRGGSRPKYLGGWLLPSPWQVSVAEWLARLTAV